MSLFQTCRPLMEAAHARQPDPTIPVWDMEYRGWPWGARWRAFPAAQLEVLKAFLGEAPGCYLQMDPSDVLDWAPSKDWVRPYKETFQLPAGLDAASLTKEVLEVGGYRLYCAKAPVEPSLLRQDPWRAPAEDFLESVRGLGITGLIAAYYDNDSWRIVFPASVPSPAA